MDTMEGLKKKYFVQETVITVAPIGLLRKTGGCGEAPLIKCRVGLIMGGRHRGLIQQTLGGGEDLCPC